MLPIRNRAGIHGDLATMYSGYSSPRKPGTPAHSVRNKCQRNEGEVIVLTKLLSSPSAPQLACTWRG